MSKEAFPNFRVNVYGDDPTRVHDIQREMTFNRPSGGGFPWPFTGRPSPTYPIGSSAPTLPSTPQPPSELPGTVPSEPPASGGIPPAVAGVFAGLTASDWMKLAAAVAGITGAVRGSPTNTNPTTGTDDPQLKELLGLMQGRLRKSEPLHDSILAMANGLLPTQYQRENPLLQELPRGAVPRGGG